MVGIGQWFCASRLIHAFLSELFILAPSWHPTPFPHNAWILHRRKAGYREGCNPIAGILIFEKIFKRIEA